MTDLELIQAANRCLVEDLPTYGYLVDGVPADTPTMQQLDRLIFAKLLHRLNTFSPDERSLLVPTTGGILATGASR